MGKCAVVELVCFACVVTWIDIIVYCTSLSMSLLAPVERVGQVNPNRWNNEAERTRTGKRRGDGMNKIAETIDSSNLH